MARKVLYIINGLGAGGAERSLAELLPELHQHDIEPIIACFYRRTEGVQDQILAQGVDVRFIDSKRGWARIRSLRKIIREERPALIHTVIYEADILGRIAAIGSRIPVLSSIVSTPYAAVRYADPNIDSRKLRILQLLDAWTARWLTTHLHAVSASAKFEAMKALGLPDQHITVVPRGRDLKRLGQVSPDRRSRIRRQLAIPEDAVVLITVGRHIYAKAQHLAIEALDLLHTSIPNLRLLIVGREGDATQCLQSMIRERNLGEQVVLLGHRKDVSDLLAASDLFLFPSRFEGMPGALIEAMALKLPIIASDIPANRELITSGHNGLLIPTDSSNALAEAVAQLLHDRKLAQCFGERNERIVHQSYTLECSTERMIELYDHLFTLDPTHTSSFAPNGQPPKSLRPVSSQARRRA